MQKPQESQEKCLTTAMQEILKFWCSVVFCDIRRRTVFHNGYQKTKNLFDLRDPEDEGVGQ
jgi:hypothetical protein